MKKLLIKINSFMSDRTYFAKIFLRIGLAVVFAYAAIASFVSPQDWIGYLPPLVKQIVPATVALNIFSAVELGLVAWLLSGVYVRWAALVAAAMLGGIVVSNLSLLPISFRDLGLMFAALALAFSEKE